MASPDPKGSAGSTSDGGAATAPAGTAASTGGPPEQPPASAPIPAAVPAAPEQPAPPEGDAGALIKTRSALPVVGAEPHLEKHGHGQRTAPTGKALAALSLGALGVVYGDIGTSPLYALKECFNGPHGVEPTPANVLGVLSLVFWALTFVVTFKYLSFVMRADNRGEGGILALLALVSRQDTDKREPAASCWCSASSARRCSTATASSPRPSRCSARWRAWRWPPRPWPPLVVPVTVLILAGLFLIQRRGTGTVGAIFGPVMLVWFVCIAALGVRGILSRARRCCAPSTRSYAVRFFAENGVHGFLVLGAVVLVITGGEALYADMGHFGKRPIRLAWLAAGHAGPPAQLLRAGGAAAARPRGARPTRSTCSARSGPSTR